MKLSLISGGLKAFVAESRRSTENESVGIREENSAFIDILLVEDDPNERALLQGLLELEGYRVHMASNGREAIAFLNHIRPKFVLLEMMMPECDGRKISSAFDRYQLLQICRFLR